MSTQILDLLACLILLIAPISLQLYLKPRLACGVMLTMSLMTLCLAFGTYDSSVTHSMLGAEFIGIVISLGIGLARNKWGET